MYVIIFRYFLIFLNFILNAEQLHYAKVALTHLQILCITFHYFCDSLSARQPRIACSGPSHSKQIENAAIRTFSQPATLWVWRFYEFDSVIQV